MITRETREGEEFSGKLRTLNLDRINLFSGGYVKDPNWPAKNIHTDLECARNCGIKTYVASGSMSEGYLSDLMADLFGEQWFTGGKLSLAFVRMVERDDTLVPKAVVRSRNTTDSGVEFTLAVWCENQRGHKVVVGTGEGAVS